MKENKLSESYINPIVSVLTGHIFTKSNILRVVNLGIYQPLSQQSVELDPVLEGKINAEGSKLLEKLLDEEDIKRYIKDFKDNANSFSPSALTSGETLRNLENSLLNIFSLLKMDKFKNLLMAPDMIEALRTLIKKDVSFIEGFKRDKNNEKNNKYEEICTLANNRLKMEIGILKQFGNNCIKSFGAAQGDSQKLPLLSTFKEVEMIVLDVFDKSSDTENLNDLVCYIKNCADFVLDNEKQINSAFGEIKKQGLLDKTLSVFQEKKFENVKFDDSLIEKLTNTLMNLLRKNIDNDNLCENSNINTN